jgi:hypothetical protein
VSAISETTNFEKRRAPYGGWSPLSLLCLAFPLTFDATHLSNQSVDSLIRTTNATPSSSITDYKENES